jgi:metal-responsive CopG/Arc/MetJ family transcriptional regulator
MATKRQIGVRFDPDFLDRLDSYVERSPFDRTTVITLAVKEYLDENDPEYDRGDVTPEGKTNG